ncbi:MAG: hypothetical protein ABJI96_16865 [Paracoccaceae bacterium]
MGDETDGAWRKSITPYAYLPFSIEGTSVVAGTSVDLDLGFDDAVVLLDFAFAGRAEFWKGDWGIIADLYYVDLVADGDATLSGPSGGTVGVDVDVKQKWAALMEPMAIPIAGSPGMQRPAHAGTASSKRSMRM